MRRLRLGHAVLASWLAWTPTQALPSDGNTTSSLEIRDIATPSMATRFFVEMDDKIGGCGWVTTSVLDRMLDDARKLAVLGQDMIKRAKKGDWHSTDPLDLAAGRLVLSFFYTYTALLPDFDRLQTAYDVYYNIEQWILKGGPTRDGRATDEPALLCSGNALKRTTEDDDLLDEDGDIVMKDGEPQLVRDDADLMRKLKLLQEVFDDDDDEKTAVPYFVPALGVYTVGETFKNDPYTVCRTAEANTWNAIKGRDVIFMCPLAFETKNDNPSNKHADPLGYHRAKPVPVSKVEKASLKDYQNLDDVEVPSAIFFHELVHLMSRKGSYPEDGEYYGLRNIMEGDIDSSLQNPETYARAALAWHYTTQKSPPGEPLIEFFSGFTTQG